MLRTLLRLSDDLENKKVGYALDLVSGRANLSRDSARRTLERLVDKGLLKSSQSKRGRVYYHVPDVDAIRIVLGLKAILPGPRTRLSALAERLA